MTDMSILPFMNIELYIYLWYLKLCFSCILGTSGSKYIGFEDRDWHSECFRCQKCGKNLVGKGFLTNGSDVICPSCGKV